MTAAMPTSRLAERSLMASPAEVRTERDSMPDERSPVETSADHLSPPRARQNARGDEPYAPIAASTGDGRQPVGTTIIANLVVTCLLRGAGRLSFTVLAFYLATRITSATLIAVVLESFYLSEFVLAPVAGSLSDRLGRKPFLLLAPVIGSVSVLWLLVVTTFVGPLATGRGVLGTAVVLALVLLGRLGEGSVTALNTPASLGSLTDVTLGDEEMRARVLTAFEIVTVSGLALSIPIAGVIASRLSLRGFLVVLGLHLLCLLIVTAGITESVERGGGTGHPVLRESLELLGYTPIRVFLPAWLAINAVVGSWLTLLLVILTYPDRIADARFPGQAIYGGFSQVGASSLMGVFGVLFILGMGGWVRILPRLSRTRVMLTGLFGLACACVALSLLNSFGSDPASLVRRLPETSLLLAVAGAGIVLLSGFPPVALTQMAAIADTLPHRHGAVMGFFSVALGVAQLLGAVLGGLAVDAAGFYGLMSFSALMGVVALGSVLALRRHPLPGRLAASGG